MSESFRRNGTDIRINTKKSDIGSFQDGGEWLSGLFSHDADLTSAEIVIDSEKAHSFDGGMKEMSMNELHRYVPHNGTDIGSESWSGRIWHRQIWSRNGDSDSGRRSCWRVFDDFEI